MMGSTDSPEDGDAVAASIFVAVAIYAVWIFDSSTEGSLLIIMQAFLVFCGFQALLHIRQSRRGAISLN
jgi:ribonuclease kappa